MIDHAVVLAGLLEGHLPGLGAALRLTLTSPPRAATHRGAMQLLAAHQILIGSAIALAVLFGVRAVVLFSRAGGAGNLLLAAVSLAVAGALVLYFRTVRARWVALRRSRPRQAP